MSSMCIHTFYYYGWVNLPLVQSSAMAHFACCGQRLVPVLLRGHFWLIIGRCQQSNQMSTLSPFSRAAVALTCRAFSVNCLLWGFHGWHSWWKFLCPLSVCWGCSNLKLQGSLPVLSLRGFCWWVGLSVRPGACAQSTCWGYWNTDWQGLSLHCHL